MANNKDFKVKNGIQPTVYNEGVGTVVSNDVVSFSDSTHTNNSMLTGGNVSNPTGMFFKPDGTKLYFMDQTDDYLAQFDLSTAWDLSTASWASKTSLVSSQMTTPEGLYIKPDGTKFYTLGRDWNRVFQYSLTTAWDASTGSYDSKYFSYSTEEQYGKGLWFKSDGTKMYITGWNNDTIFQYSLSTAWDVTTASYDSVSLALTGMDSPRSLAFSTDGTYIMSSDYQSSVVNVYFWKLGTAWDLSTVTETSVVDITSTFSIPPAGVSFKYNDIEKFYVTAIGSPDGVYEFSSVITRASLDLSTGAVFDYTPTSDVQVTVSNPAASGTVSSATLLLGGSEATGVGSTFSTTLYSGTATSEAHTVTNNIDLSTDGGLLWVKKRDSNISNTSHQLYDTERGASAGFLSSDSTNAQSTGDLSSFNTDGFTWNASTGLGSDYLGSDYVSWVFKKQSSFFDVVTYTGTGSAQTISHNLGTTVGCLIIKRTDSASSDGWIVYHDGFSKGVAPKIAFLNATDAAFQANSTYLNSTYPTSTQFSVGTFADTNASGGSYVAYLFAHDTSADSIIKCGSYTGNGSTQTIDLGWEAGWVMIKRSNSTGHWNIYDTQRGITNTTSPVLRGNSTDAEVTGSYDDIDPSSSGFIVDAINGGSVINASGGEYIYIAIRNPYLPTITYDTDLEWSGGTAPTAPAEGETDVITINTRDGGTTYQAIQAIDGAK